MWEVQAVKFRAKTIIRETIERNRGKGRKREEVRLGICK